MKRSVVLFINSECLGLGLHEGVIRSVRRHDVSFALQQGTCGDILSEAFIVVQKFVMRLF